MLVTHPGMLQQQLHLPILDILESIHQDYVIYSSIQADPAEHIVLDAVQFAKNEKVRFDYWFWRWQFNGCG